MTLADMHIPWLALNMACLSWSTLRPRVTQALALPHTMEQLREEGVTALYRVVPGLEAQCALVQQSSAFAQECERIQVARITVYCLTDRTYPEPLRWIPDPPLVLYLRGMLQPEDKLAVAVVGSRKPSNYGKLTAQRLSAELVRYGFTVVSGLARGIDGLAHQEAVRAGGRTLAVLGSGVQVVYPAEHQRLYETICDHGAVMSELPCQTKPERWHFPRRNRIISGLSLGALVVEASEHSGSLHTARHAIEQGREVFAVPGRIDAPSSRGTNGLIKLGAKLVEGIEDILGELPVDVSAAARLKNSSLTSCASSAPADVTPQEAQILALMQPDETHIETIIQASQLPAHVVASILVTLELRGLVQQFPGKFFMRSYVR